MPASLYHLFAWAIENRVPLDCTYDGHRREVCPVILGQSGGHAIAPVAQSR